MSRFNLSKVMGLVLAATMAAVPASSLATPPLCRDAALG